VNITPDTAAVQLADSAAERLRSLNYATTATDDDLTYPSDVAAVIGGLEILARRLRLALTPRLVAVDRSPRLRMPRPCGYRCRKRASAPHMRVSRIRIRAALTTTADEVAALGEVDPTTPHGPQFVDDASMRVEGRLGFTKVRTPLIADEDVARVAAQPASLIKDPYDLARPSRSAHAADWVPGGER